MSVFLIYLDGINAQRIDDEDDEMIVNDQAVERLVIVTQVRRLNWRFFFFVRS